MIFIASDIESLSRSLSGWEWAEYASEAFVIIACAGEFVADLERPWLTEERKHHLQRRSTILLVAALFASLVCLIRTNELSGSVIGFLGQRAEEAGAKAKTAIADASTALSLGKDALSKAGAAQQSLSKAEKEANQAQAAASNALTLARGARQEADSFEKDIASAKKQAAEAESHLADALQRAANAERQATQAEAELSRIRSPRSITNEPALVAALTPFKGTEYTLNVFQDDEAAQFTRAVDGVLGQAGWIRKQPGVLHLGITSLNVFGQDIKDAVPVCVETGIQIHVQAKEPLKVLQSTPTPLLPKTLRAATTLRVALVPSISPSDERNVGNSVQLDKDPGEGPVLICVGKKP